jgi:hypothetical protein
VYLTEIFPQVLLYCRLYTVNTTGAYAFSRIRACEREAKKNAAARRKNVWDKSESVEHERKQREIPYMVQIQTGTQPGG